MNPVVRHRRVGMGMDVALCGARDVPFAPSSRLLNCPACLAKLATLRGGNQYSKQMAARRAQLRGMPSDFKRIPQ